jgi:hypothetical protein
VYVLDTPPSTEEPPVIVLLIAAGWLTVAEPLAVQPLASVTVTLYVPAERPLLLLVVAVDELLHTYEYAPVPPDAVAVTLPLLVVPEFEVLHDGFVALSDTASADGALILPVVVDAQPLSSDTV